MDISFVFWAILISALVYGIFFSGKSPRQYRDRCCMGARWKNAFPDTGKHDIRKFLDLFVNAFALNQKERLKFEPNDKILEIYDSIYPLKGWPDALELETFALYMEEEYSIDIESIWSDNLTLGDLFSVAINKRQ